MNKYYDIKQICFISPDLTQLTSFNDTPTPYPVGTYKINGGDVSYIGGTRAWEYPNYKDIPKKVLLLAALHSIHIEDYLDIPF